MAASGFGVLVVRHPLFNQPDRDEKLYFVSSIEGLVGDD